MAVQTNTFKGARYVPKFYGDWEQTESYEAIGVVKHNAFTYISKQPVPANVEITNTDFWLLWADPNAQMEELRQIFMQYVATVGGLSDDVDTLTQNLAAEIEARKTDIEKAHVFETVADMKEGANLSAGTICHTNGFHTSGDGGAAWYVITDTGTANEMDVIACGDLFANLIVNKINVMQFGAYGNGVNTDDTVIVYAFEKAYIENKSIIFPENKRFMIQNELVVSNCPHEIIMESPIVYNRGGTAINIKAGVKSFAGNFKFMVESDNVAYPRAGSIGLHLENFSTSTIELNNINGFETGVKLHGNSAGFGYNQILLKYIYNCKTNLHLVAGSVSDSIGWINENLFLNGRLGCESSNSYSHNNTAIKIEGLNDHGPNANVFIKPSCEGALNAVELINASYNRFLYCRTEGVTNNIVGDSTSYNNEMTITYGTETVNGINTINNNIMLMRDIKMDRYTNVVFDSGFIPDYAFSNDNYLNAGKALAYVEASNSQPVFSSVYKGVKYNDGISITGRRIGVMIDCSNQKDFTVSCQTLNKNGFRVAVILYDENDNYIYPDNGVIGTSNRMFTKSSGVVSGLTVFSVSSNAIYKTYMHICDEAKKAFIFIFGLNENDRLQSICITSSQDNQEALSNYIGNLVDDGLTNIPTCQAKNGDFCKDASGTNFGWRYNGNEWIVVN